jgi:hypothetical protein
MRRQDEYRRGLDEQSNDMMPKKNSKRLSSSYHIAIESLEETHADRCRCHAKNWLDEMNLTGIEIWEQYIALERYSTW